MPQITALPPASTSDPSATQPSALRSFWRVLTRFDPTDISASMAARNAFCIAIPLALGTFLGYPGTGLIAASGALNAAFSDGHDPYRRRLQKMTAASAMCGFAVFLGALTGHNHVLSVVISSLWAFSVGMLNSISTAASDVGNISLFTLCVYASQSMDFEHAVYSGLAALAGGLLQTASAMVLWPTLPYQPERRALGNLYNSLAEVSDSLPSVTGAPPATAQINQAQQALTSLAHDRTDQAERLIAVLHHAERVRLSLLVLVRLRRRLARELGSSQVLAALDRFTATLANGLEIIAQGIRTARYTQRPNIAEIKAVVTHFEEEVRREGLSNRSSFVAALLRDVQFQLSTLTQQLDGVLDLMDKATLASRRALVDEVITRDWRRQAADVAATIRANLNLESAVFRHALRMSVCIAIGDATARALHTGRSYWCPMTIAIVLKPDFSSTFARGVLRVAGTVAGLILATLLFHASPSGVGTHIVFIALLSFVMRWLGPGNYGIIAMMVSAVVVMMISSTGMPPSQVIAARAANTVLGGMLALLSYAVWPTWEYRRIRPIIAALLDTYRNYFSAVMDSFAGAADPTKIDSARYAARAARSNAIASLDRASVEPAGKKVELLTLNAAVARSHDFVKCVMALEAALPADREACDSEATQTLKAEVEDYLSCLSETLRNPNRKCSKPRPPVFKSQSAFSKDPYSLVNMETERMLRALDLLGQTI